MIMKKLYIATLTLLGILISGCSSGDDSFDIQTPHIVTMTTKVGFNETATTRALTANGMKTFAAGEKIAVVYTNTSGSTVKVESAALTAQDISTDGKYAHFTMTLTNPKPNGAVTYIYPAAMANADGTPNLSSLDTQDGTLATLASTLDYAKYESTLTSGGKLPEAILLVNQLTLCKFDIKSSDGGSNINNTITKLTITNGGNTYTVDREAAVGPIYVAMQPVTSGDISFEAFTNGNCHYERTISGETLAASYLYTISMPMLMKQTLDYTGAEQTITIPKGYYLLEVWGAQGGSSTNAGGNGGYSTVIYNFTAANTTLYVYCGQRGYDHGDENVPGNGGWNGGGTGGTGKSGYYGGGGGGGATHIATGQIGAISSSNNLFSGTISSYTPVPTAKSGLLLVAGGGGGGTYQGGNGFGGDGGGEFSSQLMGRSAKNAGRYDTNALTINGSQGGVGNNMMADVGQGRGGSGGHGGGFVAINKLNGQYYSYGGCGGTGWVISNANATNGFTATGRRSGHGQARITSVNTPFQGAHDYTLQIGQSW